MKIYRKPFYKTYMMVILGASIITFVLVSPVLVEHFNMALSNGVDIDYLIKTCNHSIFRHDNFIGCFSADKIKMSARK